MRLAHFESKDYVPPIVSGLRNPTKAFVAGQEQVDWIELQPNGSIIHVHRKSLPDLIFTAMGFAVMESDASKVPGNRSGNPVEENRKGKR